MGAVDETRGGDTDANGRGGQFGDNACVVGDTHFTALFDVEGRATPALFR
jgi:hypothetical protein